MNSQNSGDISWYEKGFWTGKVMGLYFIDKQVCCNKCKVWVHLDMQPVLKPISNCYLMDSFELSDINEEIEVFTETAGLSYL